MLNIKRRIISLIPRLNLTWKISSLWSLNFLDFNFSRSISTDSELMCGTLLPLDTNISIVSTSLELFRCINILRRIEISLSAWVSLLDLSTLICDAEFSIRVMRVWIILIVFIEESNWLLTDIEVVIASRWDFYLEIFRILVRRAEPCEKQKILKKWKKLFFFIRKSWRKPIVFEKKMKRK